LIALRNYLALFPFYMLVKRKAFDPMELIVPMG
jgi:hypothetical protein